MLLSEAARNPQPPSVRPEALNHGLVVERTRFLEDQVSLAARRNEPMMSSQNRILSMPPAGCPRRAKALRGPKPAIPPETGVVLMDLTLEVLAVDRGAAAILSVPNHQRGKPEPGVCLPKELLELIRSNKSGDLTSLNTDIRVGNDEYSCRGFLLEFGNGFMRRPLAVLHLERHPSAGDALSQVAARYHLTNREQEVLGGILMGLASKELAYRMNITPSTVKAFLHLIKLKMGVTTRTGMVAKLLPSSNRGNGSDLP